MSLLHRPHRVFWQSSEDSSFRPFLSSPFCSDREVTCVIIGHFNRFRCKLTYTLTYLFTYWLRINDDCGVDNFSVVSLENSAEMLKPYLVIALHS